MAWKNPPSKFSLRYRKAHSDIAREAAIRILRGVIIRSPVDTGRFRGNWQVAEGTLPSSSVDNNQKTSGGAINASIGKIPSDMNDKLLYIVNNLPYAERLEYGWSMQAPKGMVRITLLEVSKWLESQLK